MIYEEYTKDRINMARIEEEYTLVKTDRNGTRYYEKHSSKCPKCGGKGYLYYYQHVEGGVCFLCGGSGIYHTSHGVKILTDEYAARLEAKRRERAKKANLTFFEKYGFNQEGKAYVVLGNTFNFKDQIKADGGKWFANIKAWTFSEAVADYDTVEIDASEVYQPDTVGKYSKENIRKEYDVEDVKQKIAEANVDATRRAIGDAKKYLGTVGKRQTFDVFFHTSVCFEGEYGDVFIWLMEDVYGNELTWRTSKHPDFKTDDVLKIKGTVKEHKEYRGVPQTVLTRCKVIEP